MVDQDTLIIERVRKGEVRAYAELVDRHKDRAMTVALRMLKNREDAEEAVQDAFVRAYRGLERFEGRSSFRTWLYRIVYNVCVSALEKRSGAEPGTAELSDTQGEPELPAPEEGPEALVEEKEFGEIVRQELERLPALYAGILTLFLLEDMSYEEITEATGLPLGTVKVRLFRARGLLRHAVMQRLSDAQPAWRSASA